MSIQFNVMTLIPLHLLALLGMKETKCDKILRKNVLKRELLALFLGHFVKKHGCDNN